MEDLESAMSRLVEEGADQIIINPNDIKKLLEKGVKFDKVPKRTVEESIELLFTQRKKIAINIAKKLPNFDIHIDPAVGSLYKEIRKCIIFGLYGAAITLSGILVEFVLKYSTIVWEEKGYRYKPEKMDEFEKMTLGPAIDRAISAGLLAEDERPKLIEFKDEIRNPYNHYNIKKITKDILWKNVKILNQDTHKVETKDIFAKDDPVIQAQSKPRVDAYHVLSVFNFADGMVRTLFKKIEKYQNNT